MQYMNTISPYTHLLSFFYLFFSLFIFLYYKKLISKTADNIIYKALYRKTIDDIIYKADYSQYNT